MTLPTKFRDFLLEYVDNESDKRDDAPEFPEVWEESGMPTTDSSEWKAIVAYFKAEEYPEIAGKRNTERKQLAEYFKVNFDAIRQRIFRAIHGASSPSTSLGVFFDKLGFGRRSEDQIEAARRRLPLRRPRRRRRRRR